MIAFDKKNFYGMLELFMTFQKESSGRLRH